MRPLEHGLLKLAVMTFATRSFSTAEAVTWKALPGGLAIGSRALMLALAVGFLMMVLSPFAAHAQAKPTRAAQPRTEVAQVWEFRAGSRLYLRVEQRANLQVLKVIGVVHLGDEGVFDQAFEVMKPGKRTRLWLDDFGGGFGPTILYAKRGVADLCQFSKGCRTTSYLSSTKECTSFCLLMFMGGQTRIAEKNAKFGFHSALVEYPMTIRLPGYTQARYRGVGIDSNWISQNDQLFDKLAVTYLPPERLTRSNIVTQIVEPGTHRLLWAKK